MKCYGFFFFNFKILTFLVEKSDQMLLQEKEVSDRVEQDDWSSDVTGIEGKWGSHGGLSSLMENLL